MAIKTLIFAGLFVVACVGALAAPIWGVFGYVGHYMVGPERQWWEAPLSGLGIRYSLTLALATALGIALHWRKLRFGPRLLCKTEKLMLLFLGATWLSMLFAPESRGPMFDAANQRAARSKSDPRTWRWDQNARGLLWRERLKGEEERFWRERARDLELAYQGLWGQERYTITDHPTIKMAKVFLFVLMLTHVVTDLKSLNRLVWLLILGAMVLGLQAWDTPHRAFVSGRLNSVGGPDFFEANFFAAYMAAMLWLIGAQFLRSGWGGKVVCFLAGGFAANAIILARSRGALVGLAAGGMAALYLAPRRYRGYIVVGMVLAGAGFWSLTDEPFVRRAATIIRSEAERDRSAQSRVLLAEAALRMWADHPLGVGVGNFRKNVGKYEITLAGKDNHNTYLRCLTEMGIQGFVVFLLLILGSFRTLRDASRRAVQLATPGSGDLALLGFGMTCALTTLLTCCLTISLTYVEFLWWFLMFPVCLQRAVYNAERDSMPVAAFWPAQEEVALTFQQATAIP